MDVPYIVSVEFDLEGGEATVGGNVSITLPSYITLLPQAELDEARSSTFTDRLAIAAGRRSMTGDLLVLTGTGQMYRLDRTRYEIPSGPACPVDYGRYVAIGVGYRVVVDWLLRYAERVYDVEAA